MPEIAITEVQTDVMEENQNNSKRGGDSSSRRLTTQNSVQEAKEEYLRKQSTMIKKQQSTLRKDTEIEMSEQEMIRELSAEFIVDSFQMKNSGVQCNLLKGAEGADDSNTM